MWTVQEIGFAKSARVICGKSSIDWETFTTGLDSLISGTGFTVLDGFWAPFIPTRWATRLGIYWSMQSCLGRQTNSANSNFPSKLLQACQRQIASESKDKAFALYALLTRLGVQMPIPNYSRPAADIYREVWVQVATHDQCLMILEAPRGARPTPGLASWVPDLNDFHAPPPAYETLQATGPKPDLAENQALSNAFYFSKGDTCLNIQGKIVDTISRVSDPCTATELGAQFFHDLKSWLRTLDSLVESGITTEAEDRQRIATFFKCLFRAARTVSFSPSDEKRSKELASILSSIVAVLRDPKSSPDFWNFVEFARLLDYARKYDESLARAAMDLHEMASFQSLFVTHGRHTGVGPHTAQEGDLVVLVPGCRVPVIIREQSNKTSIFVGPVHVEGMMVVVKREWSESDLAGLRWFCLS
jgi:hypothetical protein